MITILLQVESQSAPDFILFLGRFHPMILHLPIGILSLAFIFEFAKRIEKYKQLDLAIAPTLLIGAVLALITSALGYFLSLEGGYGDEILNYHKWLGVSTVILSAATYLLKRNPQIPRSAYLTSLFLMMGTLTIGGHFGGTLTHGEDYLTEYFPGRTVEVDPLSTVETLEEVEVFNHVIQPLFKDKCTSCHNPTKKKGELLLTSRENILAGGENGEIFLAGNPHESTLFKLITLPEDHDDHMPPEGKKQLSSKEIELIEWWIASGSPFDKKIADLEVPETISEILSRMLEEQQKVENPVYALSVPEVDDDDIAKARSKGVKISRVSQNTNFVQAKIYERNDQLLSILAPFKEQLIWLDVSGTQTTDEDLMGISDFLNLTKLNLSKTSITDQALKELSPLRNLEYLNVYDTRISDSGVALLKDHEFLKTVYAWQTAISSEFVRDLTNTNPNIKLVVGQNGEMMDTIRLASPIVSADQNIFRTSTTVSAELRFEGVELYYTLDGTTPTKEDELYTGPVTIQESCEFMVVAFKESWKESLPTVVTLTKVETVPESISLKNPPSDKYKGSGAGTLIDLVKGSDSFQDNKWLGFDGDHLEATVDMGVSKDIKSVRVSCLIDIGSYIFGPKAIRVQTSDDGINFKSHSSIAPGIPEKAVAGGQKVYTLPLGTRSRYLRVIAENVGTCPDWHPGAGSNAWLFVDELIIE